MRGANPHRRRRMEPCRASSPAWWVVIGVPTSVGYGAALGSVTFRHADVLFGGLTVVNIDAGSVPPPAALLIAG